MTCYTKTKFRNITTNGMEKGEIQITFERDTSEEIKLYPAPGAIKDHSPVWLWGYPVEYAPDGFEKPDRDELKIQLENPNRKNTRVCICAGPGFSYPSWVMCGNWERCKINVRIHPERRSLQIIDMWETQPKSSELHQEDDFEDDGSDAIIENVFLREDNEKLKSKIQFFTEKNTNLLKENDDLLLEKSKMLKNEIETQSNIDTIQIQRELEYQWKLDALENKRIVEKVENQRLIDELERENAALQELARKLSAKNRTVFKRARRKLKKIFCATST